MKEFFDGRSSGNIVGISTKIILSGFDKIKLKLKEANAFVLPEEEMFQVFGGICNIVVEVSILRKTKYIGSRGHLKRKSEIGFEIGVSAKIIASQSVCLRRIFYKMKYRRKSNKVDEDRVFQYIIFCLGGNSICGNINSYVQVIR